jgi:hypothetical protein
MDLADLLKPGARFRARERDYRLEGLKKDLLLARAVNTEEEALFHLPLEDRGIRLTFLGLPYVVFREGEDWEGPFQELTSLLARAP